MAANVDGDAEVRVRHGLEEIHLEVMDSNLEAVQRLILEGCNVNAIATGPSRWTPLIVACLEGNRAMVKLLLDNNADPNIWARRGVPESALHVLCAFGRTELVKLLVKRGGAHVDAQMLQGETPLITACRFGNFKIALFLLENDARVVDVKSNTNGHGGLHLCRCPRLAQALLVKGARVNAVDEIRSTALHEACRHGDLKVVKLLIEHKAKVNAKDDAGRSPLHWAAMYNHAQIAKLLITNKACVNSRDMNKCTPLHNTSDCVHGPAKVAKVLLRSGAIINARNDDGATPLHVACEEGNQHLVDVLLDYNANVHAKDEKGDSPLHVASADQFEIVRKLVAHDATCRWDRDTHGNLPLHCCKTADIAGALLEYDTYDPHDSKAPEPEGAWMAHEMFFAGNQVGQVALDCARLWMIEQEDEVSEAAQMTAGPVVGYLDSFVEETLATPGVTTTGKRKRTWERHEKGLGVKLNPRLNPYQKHLATQTLKLVLKTPAHPVAYCILGFLSPVDVMKRQPPPVV